MPSPILELYSQTHYVTDGTTTTWNFSFAGGYIDKAHVKAYRIPVGGELPIVIPILDSDVATSQVSIIPALAAGQKLVIYRETPKDMPLVDYTNGQSYDESTLDLTARQAIFVAAEIADIAGQALNVGGGVVELQELLQSTEGAGYMGFSPAAPYPNGTVGQALKNTPVKSSVDEQVFSGNLVVRRNDGVLRAARVDNPDKHVQLAAYAGEAVLEYGSGYSRLYIPGVTRLSNAEVLNNLALSTASISGVAQVLPGGSLNVQAGAELTLADAPVNPTDATNKGYVDQQVATRAPAFTVVDRTGQTATAVLDSFTVIHKYRVDRSGTAAGTLPFILATTGLVPGAVYRVTCNSSVNGAFKDFVPTVRPNNVSYSGQWQSNFHTIDPGQAPFTYFAQPRSQPAFYIDSLVGNEGVDGVYDFTVYPGQATETKKILGSVGCTAGYGSGVGHWMNTTTVWSTLGRLEFYNFVVGNAAPFFVEVTVQRIA